MRWTRSLRRRRSVPLAVSSGASGHRGRAQELTGHATRAVQGNPRRHVGIPAQFQFARCRRQLRRADALQRPILEPQPVRYWAPRPPTYHRRWPVQLVGAASGARTLRRHGTWHGERCLPVLPARGRPYTSVADLHSCEAAFSRQHTRWLVARQLRTWRTWQLSLQDVYHTYDYFNFIPSGAPILTSLLHISDFLGV